MGWPFIMSIYMIIMIQTFILDNNFCLHCTFCRIVWLCKGWFMSVTSQRDITQAVGKFLYPSGWPTTHALTLLVTLTAYRRLSAYMTEVSDKEVGTYILKFDVVLCCLVHSVRKCFSNKLLKIKWKNYAVSLNSLHKSLTHIHRQIIFTYPAWAGIGSVQIYKTYMVKL